MRLRTFESLKGVQNTTALLATFNEIDMSSLIERRARFKDQIQKEHSIRLMFMSRFARPSVRPRAQRDPPANVSIEGDSIVLSRLCRFEYRVCYAQGSRHACAEKCGGIAELGKMACDDKLTIDHMPGRTLTMFVF
jgi:2-oxoglutarate dehydrogenase E2 component (dihydrolipoamide succinyltransferase)